MKFPQNFNKDLAYILGALRDGNFVRDQKQYAYRIRIYQKNKEWILYISKLLKNMFGKETLINQDKRTGVWSTTLSSKKIFDMISELASYPGNQENWGTPEWLSGSDTGIQKEYIKGFFDAEGGVSRVEERLFAPSEIRIYFCQVNKQSLIGLRDLLNKFEIKTGKVIGPYYGQGYEKPTYGLIIHGIKNVYKFYRTIGSQHPEKIRRFEIIGELVNLHATK